MESASQQGNKDAHSLILPDPEVVVKLLELYKIVLARVSCARVTALQDACYGSYAFSSGEGTLSSVENAPPEAKTPLILGSTSNGLM